MKDINKQFRKYNKREVSNPCKSWKKYKINLLFPSIHLWKVGENIVT